MTTKHAPATPLQEVGSDRDGFFIRFPDAESAYAALRAINAYQKLVEALDRLADSHARLERERGSMVGTLTANAMTLLRSLGEE